MKIYLVAGKAGSGKGEVSKIISEYYNKNGKKTVISEFSKYLKLYAKEILGWDGDNPKPRDFLQDLGSKIKTDMNMPFFLIERMIEDVKIYNLYADVLIISDVRMPLEIEELKKRFSNVCSIYVINNFEKSKLTDKQQNDITETALDNYDEFDYVIVNDDISNLENKVHEILTK